MAVAVNRAADSKPKVPASLPAELQDERIIDVKQVAALYGVSVPHLRRMYRSRKIPKPLRIGERKYGWRVGVVREDIAARAV